MAIADSTIAEFPIAAPASAGLSDSVAETASAVDVVSALATFPSSIAETASAVDDVHVLGEVGGSIAETATASDTVSAVVTFANTISEAVSSSDVYTSVGILAGAVVESAHASDTISPLQMTLTWFLSFEEVVPAPEGEGPGNPGKLFGDYRLIQTYPSLNPRLRG